MKDFFTMSGSERNKILSELNEKYPRGTRVKLVKMNDFQAPPISTEGTVKSIDDIGTIHIQWDNGSSLGVAYGEDEIMKVN
jgi:hypothetical protein